MSDLDKRLEELVASQKELTAQLRTLVTRDPKKEFIYGPQYAPGDRRFDSNLWQILRPPASATAQVFVSPNTNEEVTLSTVLANSALTGPMLRVEMDSNPQFSKVPADFSTRTLFLPPTAVAANALAGTAWNYAFFHRFPCVFEFVRVTLVTNLNVASAWTANNPIMAGFHGK